jgi:glycosyltransferase involved in cell wall biosynthesis
MRVALLTYNAQAGDAIGNQVAEKLAFFSDRGADVRVFVESDQRLHPALRPFCQQLTSPEPVGEGWQFLASADLVVVEYGQYYGLLGLLPLLVGGKPRILFDYHGVTPPDLWGSHNREGLQQGAQHRGLVWFADAALVHSRFTSGELQRHSGFPNDWIHILGHPLDTSHYRPGRPSCHLRDLLGLEKATLLLFVGRLAPNKCVPLLVEALARLRDLTPPVHFVVIGDMGDLYQTEAQHCRERAAELGLSEHLHFLGHVSEEALRDAYRSADVFVMPSRHEGFCIPVLEAMACGIPVVAGRAGALPETVADAGLTFTPNDAYDLASQIQRVLKPRVRGRVEEPESETLLRVAVVSFRYGTTFAGGAETSLRHIATTLHEAGQAVEVFTTCTQSEGEWANDLPEGTVSLDGMPVHRFRLDPHDRTRHLDSVRTILQADGSVSEAAEQAYLRHSIHSTALLDQLRGRREEFDAIIIGPYLFGLTFDVAEAFPEQTVLVPCFHDEPFARLGIWRPVYQRVGAILYHSQEEKEWAEIELGLNHPAGACIGTWVDTEVRGNAERGRGRVGGNRPYLVYCGRYSLQKNLPTLLDYARRYEALHPGRFTFAFVGQGELPIPREVWARDLGFVAEPDKADVLAGATGLVQLSQHESLSLVTLEAWAQGTPVVASQHCNVLTGHLRRCGGGRAVDGFESFAATLDDLWQRPEHWQALGHKGRDYACTHYGRRATFLEALVLALRGLRLPLRKQMRRQGLQRAAQHDRSLWRERFGRLVERLLDAPPRVYQDRVEVRPRTAQRSVAVGQESVLVPVRVANRGTHAVMHEGPAAVVLQSFVLDEVDQSCPMLSLDTALPGMLVPGQEIAATMRCPVPADMGVYQVGLRAVHAGPTKPPRAESPAEEGIAFLQLVVEEARGIADGQCCVPTLEAVNAALTEAERRQCLPDDYTDITEGFLAGWKRWIKRKLLGNLKHAYLDVLSRQQSSFNRHVLAAIQELAECCALLDHARTVADSDKPAPGSHLGRANAGFLAAAIEGAVADGKADEVGVLLKNLVDQLAESQHRCGALEERLARLEARLGAKETTPL